MPSSKKPWEVYPHIWKTESAFMSWIRGGIRRSLWNKSPVKLEFIKNNRVKIPNPNPRGKVKEVWGGTCALTGVTLPISMMEVDHKTGGHSLRTLADIGEFIAGIVLVTDADLQLVSKEAHKTKSYAERMGISFEEARAEKEAIALCKGSVAEVKQYCLDNGASAEDVNNAAKRRAYVVKILKEKYNV